MVNARTEFVASLTDDKCDPALGQEVCKWLTSLGLETVNVDKYEPGRAFTALLDGIYSAYNNLGLDVDGDPSIKDTPRRFAKMFVGELTKGLNYDFFPKCTATPNGFERKTTPPSTASAITGQEGVRTVGAYDQMVLVQKIRTTSLCEHHLQTIDGFTHIAYIPNTKVLGLSKFARITEFFAARPQIQERMTEQIYHALEYILDTQDIAVVQTAVHFCMRARGAKQPESWTTTNKMGGKFLTNVALREELFNAIN